MPTYLLDNHTDHSREGVVSVYDYLVKYADEGELQIVTGFVSALALAHLAKELKDRLTGFKLVIGEYTDRELSKNKAADILDQQLDIESVFKMKETAREAVAFLELEQVEARTLQPNFCHAKFYLLDKTEWNWYIVGSANLTGAGLGLHHGANMELSIAGDADYSSARKWFRNLWNRKECKEYIRTLEDPKKLFKQYLIDRIQSLFVEYSPKDIYHKILFELYKDQLDDLVFDATTKKEIKNLEQTGIWRTLFPFQKSGVMSLIRMLQKYNGAILADAVGLGKTFSALAVMKFFQSQGYKVLVICPKKLENNWVRYQKGLFSRFEEDELEHLVCFHTDMQDQRYNSDQKENGRIRKLLEQRSVSKVLVVVDESHNFRNDKSSRYQALITEILQVKSDAKVLLLSATPINTKLMDVRNQFKLITKGVDDEFSKVDQTTKEPIYPPAINKINSLENLFRVAQGKFKR